MMPEKMFREMSILSSLSRKKLLEVATATNSSVGTKLDLGLDGQFVQAKRKKKFPTDKALVCCGAYVPNSIMVQFVNLYTQLIIT